MANSHLVILKKPYLDMNLEGRKRIELRLYKIRHPALAQRRQGYRACANSEKRLAGVGGSY